METLEFLVEAGNAGQRLDRFLAERELGLTRNALQQLIEEGYALCNGQPAAKSRKLKERDRLLLTVPDAKPATAVAQDIPLDVVYEDEHLLILNKPAGMTAHASNFLPDTPTVAGALAYQRGPDFIFHVVNRLDKGTTGLMAVAKSGYIHDRLRRTLHTDGFYREYRAVCVGCPEPPAGTIDAPIGRDETSAVRRMVRSDGQRAVSHYEVLSQRDGLSFVKLQPETGRTHQLRVHMAHIGCPLAGDWLYGTEDPDLISRPALHAYALALTHPVTGTHLYFTAPTPADMEKLI